MVFASRGNGLGSGERRPEPAAPSYGRRKGMARRGCRLRVVAGFRAGGSGRCVDRKFDQSRSRDVEITWENAASLYRT